MKLISEKDQKLSLNELLKKYDATLKITRRGLVDYRYTGCKFYASLDVDITDGFMCHGASSLPSHGSCRHSTPLMAVEALNNNISEQKIIASIEGKEIREYLPLIYLSEKEKKEIEALDFEGDSRKEWKFKSEDKS